LGVRSWFVSIALMGGLWVRAELRRRWRAIVALTLLVGLAGGTILTAAAGARRTATAYGRLASDRRATHLHVQMNSDLAGALDKDMGAGFTIREIIAKVRQLPVVEDVSLVGFFAVGPPGTTAGLDFTSIAPLDARTGQTVDRPRVAAGRLPKADALDEVALSAGVAKRLHLHVGDQIRMHSRSADQIQRLIFEGDSSVLDQNPDGPDLPMRVVGLISLTDDLGQASLVTPYAYLGPAFFEEYRERISVFAPTMGLRLVHGYRDVPAVTRAIRGWAGDQVEIVFDDNRTDASAIEDGLRVQSLALLALAVVGLTAAAVIIGQAFGRELASAGEDAAVLRTLGLTRRQRALALASLAVPVVAGGAAISVIGAMAASGVLPIGLARDAKPNPGLRFDPLVHLGAGLALAVVLGGLAAIAAWRASRVAGPVGGEALPPFGARLASRVDSVPAGTGLRMAFDSRRGVPARSALTGAVVAVATLVAVVTYGASLSHLLARPALAGFPWHVDIEGSEADETIRVPVAAAAADRDVEAVAVVRFISDIQVNGHHTHAAGLRSAKGAAGFTVLSGRAPEGPDEVALGPATLAALRADLGDTVRAKGQQGERGLRVVGRVLFPAIDTTDYAEGALFTRDGSSRSSGAGSWPH
jgi:hypothetical protein